MFDAFDIEVIGRLVAASIVGAIVGINRDLTNKPIGMRTLALVSLGAATVAAATLRFDGIPGNPEASARVLQGVIEGVMTGVGFIGAGVILRDHSKQTVHGLTTAATVWIAAGLGLVCGIADWSVVVSSTVLALVILALVLWFEQKLGSVERD
jgi:putative Mg2+ transporter-C (MgtC) family protein